MIFVMLGVPYNEVYNDNIFALNEEGKIAWQIEIGDCPDGLDSCKFTGLNIEPKTGNLWLYNLAGFLYTVIPETGEILDRLFTK